MDDQKPRYDPVTDTLEDAFDGVDEYEITEVWTDHPGTRMFVAEDSDGDQIAVNWEGEDRFSYEHDGHDHALDEDHDLYEVARDMLDAYPAIRFDADGRPRYAMIAHTNSGGEASQALNEPLEWGLENEHKTWAERQADGLISRILDRLP